MILLDASFLYAYYNKNDVHHEKAIKISEGLKEQADDLVVLDYVFDEVLSVSLNRLKDVKIVKTIGDDILDSLGISYINEEVFENAWNIFLEKTNDSLSFTDCVIISYMKIFYIKNLVTFDKGFLEVNGLNVVC